MRQAAYTRLSTNAKVHAPARPAFRAPGKNDTGNHIWWAIIIRVSPVTG